MEHVAPGLVGREPGPLDFHATERSDRNVSIGFAAPRASPMFEPEHLIGSFPHEDLHCILIAKPVTAADRIVGVCVQAVVRLDDCRGPTFGRHGVAPHRIDFGYDTDTELGIRFGDRDRG